MIIRGPRSLQKSFDRLGRGDIYIGPVATKHLAPFMMIDLMSRGVKVLPSCFSQSLSRSKTAQALIFENWMPPQTRSISRRAELLESINFFNEKKISKVVTKVDHKHCGHGVRLWDNIENLYSFLGLDDSSYPFVLQPFFKNFIDIRGIIAGDYIEAYKRENQYNFRCNMAAGGKSEPYQLSGNQIDFCRRIMERGDFPYAHIDLMIFDDGSVFLSEIALNGGMKGSAIDQKSLKEKKINILEELAERKVSISNKGKQEEIL